MTISIDAVFGRLCRAVTAPVALGMLLAFGLGEHAAGQEASTTEGESTESSTNVGPDWEVVEDYLERQNAWTVQVREQVLAGVPENLLSKGLGKGTVRSRGS